MGKLYICPTPIGNLEDITIRTMRILKEVDLIAAEDTRHTLKLLNHLNIKKPLTSYHEHNKWEKGNHIIERIINGESIALVSDAGMPGISDPGEELIKMAIQNDIKIEVLPGATASITALVLSGISTSKFVFEGFLSSSKRERLLQLEKIKDETRTIILYESPHRIRKLLECIDQVLNDRKIALVRELTKKFEEVNRGSAKSILKEYSDRDIKGEIVIIIEGSSEKKEEYVSRSTIKEDLLKLISEGKDKREAIKIVAKERNIPKREVYNESIGI